MLEAQYNLCNRIIVNNLRKKIINNINIILKLNGINQELILKPLTFNIQKVEETTVTTQPEVEEIKDDENEDTPII